jgi:hypothetical protein
VVTLPVTLTQGPTVTAMQAEWAVRLGEGVSSIPVEVQQVDHDWMDWVVTLATVLAFAVAVVAIWLTLRLDKKTAGRILVERERVFELEVLRDLLTALDNNTAFYQIQTARLTIFGDDELPVWRDLSQRLIRSPHLPGEEQLRRLLDNHPRDPRIPFIPEDEARKLLQADVTEAITTRMRATKST